MSGQEKDRDEILRATIALLISSLDYLIHEIILSEVAYRFNKNETMSKVEIPFDVLSVQQHEVLPIVLGHIKSANGYKSFVAPDKIGSALNVVFPDVWKEIASHSTHEASSLKRKLKLLVERRNRVVHEADINPDLSMGELWSIDKEDVSDAIDFISELGANIVKSVEGSRLRTT